MLKGRKFRDVAKSIGLIAAGTDFKSNQMKEFFTVQLNKNVFLYWEKMDYYFSPKKYVGKAVAKLVKYTNSQKSHQKNSVTL